MDKEMKTMIREIREDTGGIREETKVLRKELAAVREKGELRKMIEEQRKKERKNNVTTTGIGAIRGNIERGVEEWLEGEIGVKVNVKEAFKINKDNMMLAKIESCEQKKNIMLNKS
jgi:hypothetical protein